MSRPLGELYGTLFLDCPPVRMLVQLQQFVAAEGWTDVKLLPFFSMVDRRKSLHHEVIASTRAEVPALLATEVPYSSELERMPQRRAPLPATGRDMAGSGRAPGY
jgi:hypothetical protein